MHQRLVMRLARRYTRQNVSVEDLINEGSIGLLRAARKFDPSHGLPFIPYASWWIKQAMIMFLIQHGQGAISLPIRKVQLSKRIRREEDTLKTVLGRSPTDVELSQRLSRSPEEIAEVRNVVPEYVGWEEYLAQDVSGNDIDQPHPAEAREDQRRLRRALGLAVNELPSRDQRGVRLYFGLEGGEGMNFADLGRRLDMTREGARQMIKRSLRRLRMDPSIEPLTAFL
jgi:RNA polymerase sigma factor (sigma-70 family)